MAVTRAGAPLEPERLRRTIDDTLASAAVGAPPTWTLPDHADTRRARAVLLLLLALPGSVVLHQGEEPGLEEAGEAHVHDPVQEPDSMPAFYRSALITRRSLVADMAPTVTWLGGPEGVLAFSRGNFGCTLNLSDEPVPAIGPVLLSSAPVRDGVVPPEVAVWTSGLPGADQAAQHAVHEGR